MTANECHPLITLVNEHPVPIKNRRHYASHSVFDLRDCSTEWRVVFVNKNKHLKQTLVIAHKETASVTVDMAPEDYEAFWQRLWGQKLPALVVKSKGEESREGWEGPGAIDTIDLKAEQGGNQ